jgi:hypothetical protein
VKYSALLRLVLPSPSPSSHSPSAYIHLDNPQSWPANSSNTKSLLVSPCQEPASPSIAATTTTTSILTPSTHSRRDPNPDLLLHLPIPSRERVHSRHPRRNHRSHRRWNHLRRTTRQHPGAQLAGDLPGHRLCGPHPHHLRRRPYHTNGSPEAELFPQHARCHHRSCLPHWPLIHTSPSIWGSASALWRPSSSAPPCRQQAWEPSSPSSAAPQSPSTCPRPASEPSWSAPPSSTTCPGS